MATLDQLSAEQRAIIELVLQRGLTYAELATRLGIPEGRVRELARDALVELAPVTAKRVPDDWRGQLADYVLGQQSGPESTATRGHLRRSEAARAWASSLLDSLEGFYRNGMPSIPGGDRGRRVRVPHRRHDPREPGGDQATERPRAAALSPEARAAVRRRRLLAAAGVLSLLALLAVLVWPIGVLTGDDEEASRASGRSPIDTSRRGQAVVVRQGRTQAVQITASGLEPSTRREAYVIWLYNSRRSAKPLAATATTRRGQLQGAARLPSDFRRYRFLDISRQTVGAGARHSGQSVMRGTLEFLRRPVARGRGRSRVELLANVRLLPLPDGRG